MEIVVKARAKFILGFCLAFIFLVLFAWGTLSTSGLSGLVESVILREIALALIQASATLAGLFVATMAISTQRAKSGEARMLVYPTCAALAALFVSIVLLLRAEDGGLIVKAGYSLAIGLMLIMIILAMMTVLLWSHRAMKAQPPLQ